MYVCVRVIAGICQESARRFQNVKYRRRIRGNHMCSHRNIVMWVSECECEAKKSSPLSVTIITVSGGAALRNIWPQYNLFECNNKTDCRVENGRNAFRVAAVTSKIVARRQHAIHKMHYFASFASAFPVPSHAIEAIFFICYWIFFIKITFALKFVKWKISSLVRRNRTR